MNSTKSIRWYPDVTVAAVCEQNGRFLLVEERAKSTGDMVFNQPAGHLEPGESIIEGVIREVLEETCRHFTPKSLIGLYRLPMGDSKTYIRYTFAGDVSDIDPEVVRDPDITDTHWMSYSQIQQHESLRSELVLRCIDDYKSGESYPLSTIKELVS